MSEIVGIENFAPEPGTSVSRYLEMGLDEYIDKFALISESATKEYSLEKAMEKMMIEWEEIEFTLLPYRETGTYILSVSVRHNLFSSFLFLTVKVLMPNRYFSRR